MFCFPKGVIVHCFVFEFVFACGCVALICLVFFFAQNVFLIMQASSYISVNKNCEIFLCILKVLDNQHLNDLTNNHNKIVLTCTI